MEADAFRRHSTWTSRAQTWPQPENEGIEDALTFTNEGLNSDEWETHVALLIQPVGVYCNLFFAGRAMQLQVL